MELVPVDHDPFADDGPRGGVQPDSPLKITVRPERAQQDQGPQFVPVDHDPFANDGPSYADYASDVLQSIPSGVAKGAAMMVGLPGDVSAGVGYLMDRAEQKVRGEGDEDFAKRVEDRHAKLAENPPPNLLPTTDAVRGAVGDVTGRSLYEPRTAPGQVAGRISEFVPGALSGGGGVVRNLTNLAVVPAVTSEIAGQATKGTPWEPWARAAGGLVGGGVASVVNRRGAVPQTIRGNMPEGVTAQHVDQAQQLIDQAAHQGVSLTWPEALSKVAGQPVLTDTQRILESAPQSRSTMQNFMGGRTGQVDAAARSQFDNIAPAAPNPSAVGPAASRAAGAEIDSVRRRINQTAEPYYDAAAPVRLTPEEMARVRALPGYDEAVNAVRNDPQLNRHVSRLPEDSIGFLNEVKKQLDQQQQNAKSKFAQNRNQQRAAGFGTDASKLRTELTDAYFGDPARNYETALNIESQGRQQFLQPLLDGPLGRIADQPATKKAIEVLFPDNPLPHSSDEISHAVGAVAKRSEWAARQLVRGHLEMQFNETTRNLQSGPNQWGGPAFAAKVVGNPQQRENLRAAVEALPGGHGTWGGFTKFLDVMEAMAARQHPGSKTAFNDVELKSLASGGAVSGVARTAGSPGKWWTLVNDKWGQWQLGKNLGELANVLTDPKSGPLLRQIANLPSGSRAAQITALRLALITNTARQGSTRDK